MKTIFENGWIVLAGIALGAIGDLFCMPNFSFAFVLAFIYFIAFRLWAIKQPKK